MKELDQSELRGRIEQLRQRVAEAALRAGRDPAGVRVIAVSKNVPAQRVAQAAELGLRDFGENRIQEWLDKVAGTVPDLRWHMIGHLQTNKVRYLRRGIAVVHSLDRKALLREVDRRWAGWREGMTAAGGVEPHALLQVNIAGEDTKGGFSPGELEAVVAALAGRPAGVPVRGLMTIAPYVDDAEKVRWVFAALRRLRDAVASATGHPLPELSMGMSGDYMVAIEEGATLIRVGTAIFGPRG